MYKCELCGKSFDKLTYDHVPPKVCGNDADLRGVKQQALIKDYKSGKERPYGELYQGGLKFKTLCSSCNNRLGENLDIELGEFCHQIRAALITGNNKIKISCDISKVVKDVFAHIIAATAKPRTTDTTLITSMKDYYWNNSIANIHLYFAVYPYLEKIFIAQDVFPVQDLNKHYRIKLDGNHIYCCLYFYPVAFIATDNPIFPVGIDLMNYLDKSSFTFGLEKNFWYSKDKKNLPISWPINLSYNDYDEGVDMILSGEGITSTFVASEKLKI